MADDWKTEDEMKRRLILENQRLVRFIVKYFFICSFAAVIVFSVYMLNFMYSTSDNLSFESTRRPTYFPAEFFFNAQSSPVYEIIWLTQMFLCFILSGTSCCFHSFFIMAVFHAHDQLNILKMNMKNLMFLSNNEAFESIIKTIVESHVQLKR